MTISAKITYERLPGDQIRVRVAETITERIVRAAQGGWQYKPIASNLTGDVFPTIEQVKRSLEGDDDD